MKRERDWYKIRGTMQLIKDEKVIRQYRFNDIYARKRMLRIWNSEITPNGISCYELIIIPEIDANIR